MLTILLIQPSLSHAAAPDAGILMNEQQQMQQSAPDRLPGDGEEAGETAPAADSGVKVLVKGFRFSGIEGVAAEAELMNIVNDAVGRELSFAELQQLAAKVTGYLKTDKDMILARAYLPQQDVTGGVIEIAIIAGRAEGNARVNIAGPSRINPGLLEGMAARAITPDEALHLAKIERSLLLINDLPGISAKASVEQGDSAGTSRLIINASEGKLLNTVISADNYGDRYTGALRGVLQSSLDDPSGLGDQVILSLNKAERLNQARLGYSLPVGTSGLTGSVYYSYLDYEIGKELEALEAKGTARTMGGSFSYPVMRTRKASLWTSIAIDRMDLEDEALGEATGDRGLLTGRLGINASLYDGFGGGGMTMTSLNVNYGDTDLSGLKTAEAYDEAGPDTSGRFRRATYSVSRLQRISYQTALFLSARGQFSNKNLDSSQKFILGGPTGVRAYPVGEGAGDEGHIVTAEMRYDLSFCPSWMSAQLVGFMDAGMVKLHKKLWSGAIANAADSNRYSLSGWGMGVNIGRTSTYSLRMSYARAAGDNDGRNQDGTNADNQKDKGRFWLQGVFWF